MDDMGDAISFWNFEREKNERRERERELYLVTFFLDLSCVTKHLSTSQMKN